MVKSAIDDFAKLNIEDKGKRIFEGLTIRTKNLNANLSASFGILNDDCDIQYNDKQIESKRNEAYSRGDWEAAKNILKTHPPDKIEYKPILTLNKQRNFNNSSNNCRGKRNSALNTHSTKTYKGIIQHELGHMLHMKYAFA